MIALRRGKQKLFIELRNKIEYFYLETSQLILKFLQIPKVSNTNRSDLWRAFRVRPDRKSETKPRTASKYCVYDKPHYDYLYTDKWIDLISFLVTSYGFTKENIHEKCFVVLKL